MRKLFAIFASMLLCSFANCGRSSDKLVVLTSADNPPYEFVDSTVIVGFDIDLIKLIAERMGKRCEIKDMPFSSIIPSLSAGHGDVAIAAITPTDLRRRNLNFSIPYHNNTSALVIVRTETFDNVEDGAYFPIELLKGKVLGVQLGTHHESDIRDAKIEDLTIRRYDSVNDLVAEMAKSAHRAGLLYGIVLGVQEAKAIVRQNDNLTFYKLKFEDSFAIALPKKSHLMEEIDHTINKLISEKKISELEEKWGISK